MKRLLGTDFGWRLIDAMSTLTILLTVGATLAIFVQAYGDDTRKMQVMTAEVVDEAPPTRYAARDTGSRPSRDVAFSTSRGAGPRASSLPAVLKACLGISG